MNACEWNKNLSMFTQLSYIPIAILHTKWKHNLSFPWDLIHSLLYCIVGYQYQIPKQSHWARMKALSRTVSVPLSEFVLLKPGPIMPYLHVYVEGIYIALISMRIDCMVLVFFLYFSPQSSGFQASVRTYSMIHLKNATKDFQPWRRTENVDKKLEWKALPLNWTLISYRNHAWLFSSEAIQGMLLLLQTLMNNS